MHNFSNKINDRPIYSGHIWHYLLKVNIDRKNLNIPVWDRFIELQLVKYTGNVFVIGLILSSKNKNILIYLPGASLLTS